MAEWVQLRAAKKRDHAYFIRLRTLIELRGEATHRINYPGEYQHGQTEAWKLRAATALTEILGVFHPLTEEIDQLWSHKTPDDPGTQQQHWRKAEGILNAAIASYTFRVRLF